MWWEIDFWDKLDTLAEQERIKELLEEKGLKEEREVILNQDPGDES
jgi:hypothetical protein